MADLKSNQDKYVKESVGKENDQGEKIIKKNSGEMETETIGGILALKNMVSKNLEQI